jgi:hypothetical protein
MLQHLMTKQHNEKHAYIGISKNYLVDLKLYCKQKPFHWIFIVELPKNGCQIISIGHRHLQASYGPLSRFVCNPAFNAQHFALEFIPGMDLGGLAHSSFSSCALADYVLKQNPGWIYQLGYWLSWLARIC